MNERFRVTSNPKYLSVVFDERKKRHYVGTDLEDLLNEQDEKIKEIETENEQLQRELDCFHPVMFQDMRKGTVVLYLKELK